jgi:hypothetical protein
MSTQSRCYKGVSINPKADGYWTATPVDGLTGEPTKVRHDTLDGIRLAITIVKNGHPLPRWMQAA